MNEATLQVAATDTEAATDTGTPRAPEAGSAHDWRRIDTPALLVDLDRLETNVGWMADQARSVGLALRPHVKTHKSAEIAKRQLAAGAVGITVAKLDEAEALVDGGVTAPILLAFQIVAEPKLDRAVRLASRVPLTVAIDSAEGAASLSAAARSVGLRIDVWIEIDSGLLRAGVLPADAPALARAVNGLEGVRLKGMFTHAGQSYAAGSPAEVEAIAGLETRAVVDAAMATRAIGIPIESVSAGSTPTARFLRADTGLTEMRPGTYVFYDELQVALGTTTADHCALSIAATVVSRPAPDRAVIDAGSKTLGLDRGAHSSSLLTEFGRVLETDGALVRLSEEHGVLSIPSGSPLAIGDRVRIVPNHVCSATNLGRRFYGLRGSEVVEVITIDAAGGVH